MNTRIPPFYRIKVRQGHEIGGTVARAGNLIEAVDAFIKTMLHPPNSGRYVELWEDDHLSILSYPNTRKEKLEMINRPFAQFKQPESPYDVWHVCYCDKCKGRESKGSKGRVWTHSQADWNQHLRYVDPDKIATFPTIKKESEK